MKAGQNKEWIITKTYAGLLFAVFRQSRTILCIDLFLFKSLISIEQNLNN